MSEAPAKLQPQAHRNLLKIIASALRQTFDGKAYADQVLERTLKGDSRLGARDRKFIAGYFYDMVRYWRQVLWLEERALGQVSKDFFVKVLLWVHKDALYRMDHMEEALILPEATVLEGLLYGRDGIEMPPVVKTSFPDWLYQWGTDELKDRWPLEAAASNDAAPIYLRTNRLKTTPGELQSILASEGVQVLSMNPSLFPDALAMTTRDNVIRLGSFRKGLYEVQDASSQRIAPFLDVEPGMEVIDACAGAGGKTLHLAALMENEGSITAMDVEGWKLGELIKRARRNGIEIIETRQIRTEKDIKMYRESCDRLLLDAPCTGMGVLRRHPDSKWKLTAESVKKVQDTQAQILDSYPTMLRPGGKLVYATCSIMPSENERQVMEFVAAHPEFEIEDMVHTWPSEGYDGFFMARMKKG